jgi:hypothetical protein
VSINIKRFRKAGGGRRVYRWRSAGVVGWRREYVFVIE